MNEQKPTNTGLIVVVSILATIIVIGIIVVIWYFSAKNKEAKEAVVMQTAQTTQTPTQTATTTTQAAPSETAVSAAENFLKSIFDTFPGSSVDLGKAKKYLSSDLANKVNESDKYTFWDLHGYIHSGPCSASVLEISKTDTTAVEEVATEWGESCVTGVEEPYYRYKMEVRDGQWVITEIEQLHPATPGQEMVPRDF